MRICTKMDCFSASTDAHRLSASSCTGKYGARIVDALKAGGHLEAGSVRKIAMLIGARKSTIGALLATGAVGRGGKAIWLMLVRWLPPACLSLRQPHSGTVLRLC